MRNKRLVDLANEEIDDSQLEVTEFEVKRLEAPERGGSSTQKFLEDLDKFEKTSREHVVTAGGDGCPHCKNRAERAI